MKTRPVSRWLGLLALAGVLPALLGGCQTNRVDWNSRVATHTFSQAVLDMGPPDRQARLDDGTVVAEWETRRSHAVTTFAGGHFGRHGHHAGFASAPMTTVSPAFFLRLTFGPDGKLAAWKRGAR